MHIKNSMIGELQKKPQEANQSHKLEVRQFTWEIDIPFDKIIHPKGRSYFHLHFFYTVVFSLLKRRKKNSNHVPILQKKDITMLLCCRKIFKCKSLPSLVCPSNQLEWNQNWRIIQCAIELSLDYSEYKKLKNSAEHIVVLFEEAH